MARWCGHPAVKGRAIQVEGTARAKARGGQCRLLLRSEHAVPRARQQPLQARRQVGSGRLQAELGCGARGGHCPSAPPLPPGPGEEAFVPGLGAAGRDTGWAGLQLCGFGPGCRLWVGGSPVNASPLISCSCSSSQGRQLCRREGK